MNSFFSSLRISFPTISSRGKGFFSVIVVVMAMLLLVGATYWLQAQQQSDQSSQQSLVAQQTLSKEWFLARNAYSRFASDAIAEAIDTTYNAPFSAGNCTNAAAYAMDFTPRVTQRWNDVNVFMQQHYDVNCAAIISPSLEQGACGAACGPPFGVVAHAQDVFVELTCTKTINGHTFTLAHPFVLNKFVNISLTGPTCAVDVSDYIPSAPVLEVHQSLT
jgi:hypothetical protein